jgi:four helix bundle protein
MRDFRKIKAFQYADDLVIEVYKLTQKFPKDEIYGVTSQLRRAAVSVAANIAEGSSRQHQKDYSHFLSIAKSSLSEVEYLLTLVVRLGYLNQKDFERINGLSDIAARTLYGLIQSVRKEI